METVRSLVGSLQFEEAKNALEKLLEEHPEDAEGWRTLGEVECELGDTDVARKSDTESSEYRRSASKALVGMTELYLTDLCFEDNAEQECERLLEMALSIDPSDPEVHQTLASVRLSQSRPTDAQQCLWDSFNLWRNLHPDSPDVPSYDTRISLSRLFLETSLYVPAIEVLSRLLAENDEDKQVYYLLSLLWSFVSQKKAPHKTSSISTPFLPQDQNSETNDIEESYESGVQAANGYFDDLKNLCDSNPEDDDADMIEQLQAVLPAEQANENPDESEVVEEEEWIDDEDDDSLSDEQMHA